jgi:hypothetical protein
MMVPVTLLITDDSIAQNAVEDVVVRFYSEDGATFVTQAQTDAEGELALDLEDATTYWVRFFKIGYQFESKLTIDVDSGAASNTFDVEAVDLTVLPPSTVPILCRVGGYVAGGDLTPRPGITFTFVLTGSPRVASGRVMVLQDLIAVTDADGWLEVELVRGATYDCTIEGQDDCVYRVKVPDRTSINVTELIWPYLTELVYQQYGVDVTSVTVAAGATVDIDVFVRFSSGVVTPFKYDGDATWRDVDAYVSLLMEDDGIATRTVAAGVMSITGVAAGATDLTATLRPGLEAERLPEPTRTLPTLTINVTA